jgi:broad specificity phosphatase PhoE
MRRSSASSTSRPSSQAERLSLHAYLSHPEVRIDPAVPVPRWGLSERGRARAEALAASAWPRQFGRIVTSGETKAIETGAILGATLGLQPVAIERMHENDRSATGFLPPPEFEQVANAFFARPHESVRGWERAADAQARIVAEVGAILDAPDRRAEIPTLFVGHGGVGTLLLCHCAGSPIQRVDAHRARPFMVGDQPAGGGNAFRFRWKPVDALSGWTPIEQLI